MPRRRRTRRATLRGWWKPLPFLLLPFGILLTFSWLEAQRLQNEYVVIDLITEIRGINDDIERLEDERRGLNRIELMDQKAPTLDLVEPAPGQVKVLSSERVAASLARVREHREPAATAKTPTRSVEYDLQSPAAEPDTLPRLAEQTEPQ